MVNDPRKMSETQLQSAIIEMAKLFGWLYYHTYDSRRSASGFPDLVLVRGRRLIFAELKSDTGTVSPAQRDWIGALRGARCDWPTCRSATPFEVYIWRPDDWKSGTIEHVLTKGALPRTGDEE